MNFALIYLVTRSMSRSLAQANHQQRQNNLPLLSLRIFRSFVPIPFNAALERELFLRRPTRIIRRRHSIAENQNDAFNSDNVAPTSPVGIISPTTSGSSRPAPRKRRAQSVERSRKMYIGAENLTAVIENLRHELGKIIGSYLFILFKYCSFGIFLLLKVGVTRNRKMWQATLLLSTQ